MFTKFFRFTLEWRESATMHGNDLARSEEVANRIIGLDLGMPGRVGYRP
jgi:hypothetical protein